ncbi:MAG: MFS transporter [Actinomycetota bacterium]|nr:MFS transporter [Actinomycetota bacterium]
MQAPSPPPAGSFWQLIRSGPFARLWWAGLISSLGDWVALFATLALADRIGGRGGSPETAILVPLVGRMLPSLLFGPLAGVLADRWDRRKSMVLADVGRALLVLSLLAVDDLRSLFLVSVLLEVLTLVWAPAKEASVPNLVARERLVTANGLFLGAAYGTFPLGSAVFALLAGLSSATSGLGGLFGSQEDLAFLVDSLTFLAAAALVWTIRFPSRQAQAASRPGRFDLREPLRDLWEGVRFVAGRGRVRAVVVGMAVALFGGGMVIALGVTYARRVLGADAAGFGALVTVLGTGAGLGMLAMAAFGTQLLRRDVMFGLSVVLTGISLSAASLVRTVAGATPWIFLLGLGSGASYVMGYTHLHEQVEDRLRGRTFGALLTLVRTGMLLAISVAGVSAAALNGLLPPPFDSGTRNVLFLGGLIVLLSGLGTLWSIRGVFARPKLTPEALRYFQAASEAFTSISGDVRAGKEEEQSVGTPSLHDRDAAIDPGDASQGEER